MKTLLIFCFLFFSINIQAKSELDSLFSVLDQIIQNRKSYEIEKEIRISKLKQEYALTKLQQEQYLLNKKIIKEYRSYLCDSAIAYSRKNIELAQKLNIEEYKIESELKLSQLLASSGLFTESLKLLNSVHPTQLSNKMKKEYYMSYSLLYNILSKYTDDEMYAQIYRNEIANYVDSAYNILPTIEFDDIEQIYKLYSEGRYEETLKILLDLIPKTDPSSHTYAILTSRLAYTYMVMGREPKLQKKYLIMAAIVDMKLAVKENSALLNLAILINQEGDIDRAYGYVRVALEDANFCNSRYRNVIIAKVQPIIESAYLDKIDRQQRNLKFYLILVSILGIGLVMTTLYIYKQIKIVERNRKRLKDLNNHLDEANHIKEEYIGYFLNQCSIYINKLDEFKQVIYRRITTGQIDDLRKMVSISESKKDIEELYANFDNAFLRLYPNFVDEFNAILKEEERYKLKSNELNTELRIFALIRLGITDNKQISSFLRYSIQTIYNYRSKVKGKALLESEDFEEKIKNIASLS